MFRPASRLIARSYAPRSLHQAGPARKFLSTAPPTQKSRSWKSSALRWGLALGAVYYYNNSSVFAEEPAYAAPHIPETEQETEILPTIESIAAQRRQRNGQVSSPSVTSDHTTAGDIGETDAAPSSIEELEEADQQGAFNPETGEINWDCPCLGGMAHGPCGEEFKAAFSCFVYSTEEPKGMDCIEKFKGMQNCFRQHPDIYGAELDDDDDMTADERYDSIPPAAAAASSSEGASQSDTSSPPIIRAEKITDDKPHHKPSPKHELEAKRERARVTTKQVKGEHEPQSESDEVVPRA